METKTIWTIGGGVAVAAAAGAAVYFATKGPASAASGGKPNLANAPPQTGPQALSRAEQIALFQALVGRVIVNSGTTAIGDTGMLLDPADVAALPSPVTAPALSLVYNANMLGHQILAKNVTDAAGNLSVYVLVAALGTGASGATPGSDWHVFLSPKEASAIATAAGVDTSALPPPVDPSIKPQGGSLTAPPAKVFKTLPSGRQIIVDNPIFSQIAAKKAADAAAKAAAGITAEAQRIANLDMDSLPSSLSPDVQSSVASGDVQRILAQADKLASQGYTVASGQLYAIARSAGWQPTSTDHPWLMTIDDLGAFQYIDDASAPADVSKWGYQGGANAFTGTSRGLDETQVAVMKAARNAALNRADLNSLDTDVRRSRLAAMADELDSYARTLADLGILEASNEFSALAKLVRADMDPKAASPAPHNLLSGMLQSVLAGHFAKAPPPPPPSAAPPPPPPMAHSQKRFG